MNPCAICMERRDCLTCSLRRKDEQAVKVEDLVAPGAARYGALPALDGVVVPRADLELVLRELYPIPVGDVAMDAARRLRAMLPEVEDWNRRRS